MKPRKLKDGRLVVPYLEIGGMLDGAKEVMSVGLIVVGPDDPAFAQWQSYMGELPTDEESITEDDLPVDEADENPVEEEVPDEPKPESPLGQDEEEEES